MYRLDKIFVKGKRKIFGYTTLPICIHFLYTYKVILKMTTNFLLGGYSLFHPCYSLLRLVFNVNLNTNMRKKTITNARNSCTFAHSRKPRMEVT